MQFHVPRGWAPPSGPEAWTFFKQLDGEKRGEVTTEDFLMGCLRPQPVWGVAVGAMKGGCNAGFFMKFFEADDVEVAKSEDFLVDVFWDFFSELEGCSCIFLNEEREKKEPFPWASTTIKIRVFSPNFDD